MQYIYIYGDKGISCILSLSCELRICQLAHENIAERESRFHENAKKNAKKIKRKETEKQTQKQRAKNHMTSSAEARVVSFLNQLCPQSVDKYFGKGKFTSTSSHYLSTLESKVTRLHLSLSRSRNRKLCEKLTCYAEGNSGSHEVIAAGCPPRSVSITVKRATSLDSQLGAAQATQA